MTPSTSLLDPGENINTDWRRRFAEEAASVQGQTQVVHVPNGCFLDMGVLFGFLEALDLNTGTMSLWGNGHQAMDLHDLCRRCADD